MVLQNGNVAGIPQNTLQQCGVAEIRGVANIGQIHLLYKKFL